MMMASSRFSMLHCSHSTSALSALASARSKAASFSSGTTPRYTLAIARQVPKSFANAVVKFAETENPISLETARQQHDKYLHRLRENVPTLCLPPLDAHPDSVFVEDTVVAVGKRAVITNPGHPSRRGEVETIKEVLNQLGMQLMVMDQSRDAICDGGDVLFTSRHLFVGLSERTNTSAVNILRDFLQVETVAVPFVDEALHLKSVITHLDSTTLLAPTGSLGDEVLRAMKAAELGYSIVRLPDVLACNVVSVNGMILAQDTDCDESKAKLLAATSDRNLRVQFLRTSEVAKCDGALTCCSVLLSI
jgi:dimethylargininase